MERLKGIVGHLLGSGKEVSQEQTSSSSEATAASRVTMAINLEETLAKGVEEGKIPHAVVCATNRDGMARQLHMSAS